MSNPSASVRPRFVALMSHGLLAAAVGLAFGVTSCAKVTGPGAEVATAPAPGSDTAQSSAMVPASGVDTGRGTPASAASQPELASDAVAGSAESAPASSESTDGSRAVAEAPTAAMAGPSEGTTQDLPVEGADAATRSPLAALLAPSVSFMLNYPASGARTLAEAACDGAIKDDAQKRAECLQDARDDFKADVLVFDPLGKDRYTLTIYSRRGSLLKEVFASTVELKDASEQSVTMRFVGGQRGLRPIFGGKAKVTLVLSTDSSLAIEDPKYGILPYSAKVGLVQNR